MQNNNKESKIININNNNGYTHHYYELDLDKIESIEDCKEVLKFLSDRIMAKEILPINCSYNNIPDKYFKEKKLR